MLPFPSPNDKIGDSTVIASVWGNDDPGEEFATVILLNPEAPYYTVTQVELWHDGYYRLPDARHHMNINYAVEDYAKSGGDV